MTTKDKNRKTLWQIIKFTLFSISAGLIQALAFTVLNEWVQLPYWGAYLVALVLSVMWNFTFNRRYTFRSDCNVPKAMMLVFLFYVVFTPLSTWWGDAMNKSGINEYIVLGFTMLVNFAGEYLYQKYVVYRKTIDTNDLAQREKEKR